MPLWHEEFSIRIHMHVHEYIPVQQLCFSTCCIVKEIGTMLFQGIAAVTVVYVNPLWSYKDSHSSVNEIDM